MTSVGISLSCGSFPCPVILLIGIWKRRAMYRLVFETWKWLLRPLIVLPPTLSPPTPPSSPAFAVPTAKGSSHFECFLLLEPGGNGLEEEADQVIHSIPPVLLKERCSHCTGMFLIDRFVGGGGEFSWLQQILNLCRM